MRPWQRRGRSPRPTRTPVHPIRPGNLVVGSAAGVADRIADMLNGLAQGGVTAIGDIIATVLRRDKPRVSPRGAKVARSTATQVRSSASDATRPPSRRRAGRRTPASGRHAPPRPRDHRPKLAPSAPCVLRSAAAPAPHEPQSRGQGNGDLCPQVGEADGNHRQAGATTTGRTARKAAASTTKSARRAARETASTAGSSH